MSRSDAEAATRGGDPVILPPPTEEQREAQILDQVCAALRYLGAAYALDLAGYLSLPVAAVEAAILRGLSAGKIEGRATGQTIDRLVSFSLRAPLPGAKESRL